MLSRRAGLSATAGLSCLALSVYISKTVADTAKVTISDYSKSYIGFRLTPRSITLDDLELL